MKYWKVFQTDECDVNSVRIVICKTKKEAIDTYIKKTDFQYEYENDNSDSDSDVNDNSDVEDQLYAKVIVPLNKVKKSISNIYWLLFTTMTGCREDYNAHYVNLIICPTKQEAIDIFKKKTGFEYHDDDNHDNQIGIIKLKPLIPN
ncbi:hypothetical protein [Powai lake megavirus]|uniref:Uncharacterized protein n=1 Tax=Powai lake megavirus TaxID=1842663 RepID=A0A167R0W1_9VIRU|nr:hypothetical protein QJ849_gp018 [Powai lake megavirus]ANB50180.1 hypothetical protein [Powai lake megavirus]